MKSKEINHSWIGKYTVRPMDGMGNLESRLCPIFKATGLLVLGVSSGLKNRKSKGIPGICTFFVSSHFSMLGFTGRSFMNPNFHNPTSTWIRHRTSAPSATHFPEPKKDSAAVLVVGVSSADRWNYHALRSTPPTQHTGHKFSGLGWDSRA